MEKVAVKNNQIARRCYFIRFFIESWTFLVNVNWIIENNEYKPSNKIKTTTTTTI